MECKDFMNKLVKKNNGEVTAEVFTGSEYVILGSMVLFSLVDLL